MRAWKDSVSLKSSGHALKNTTVPILKYHWSIDAYVTVQFFSIGANHSRITKYCLFIHRCKMTDELC